MKNKQQNAATSPRKPTRSLVVTAKRTHGGLWDTAASAWLLLEWCVWGAPTDEPTLVLWRRGNMTGNNRTANPPPRNPRGWGLPRTRRATPRGAHAQAVLRRQRHPSVKRARRSVRRGE